MGPLLKLYLSLRQRYETARKRTRNVHQPLPSDRQKQREHVSRKTERQRDNPRDKGEERRGGAEKDKRADETVSLTVPRKQVEDKGRMVASQRWRRWMDKRACESTLGCQTHCQTRGRFLESAFAVVNQARLPITGLHKIRQGEKNDGGKKKKKWYSTYFIVVVKWQLQVEFNSKNHVV